MKPEIVNLYGDQRVATVAGKGIDVASQRADDLDLMAVEHIKAIAEEKQVIALDAGCGRGGQTVRMAKAGASVIAMDSHDYHDEIVDLMRREGVNPGRIFFYRASVESQPEIGAVDVIMCQRMIHYLKPQNALMALSWFHRISVPGGRMFLSASGLDSELGNGYAARDIPADRRFAHLSAEMSEKHAILSPVCLYRPEELAGLASEAGWKVENVFVSPFGNVKMVASKA